MGGQPAAGCPFAGTGGLLSRRSIEVCQSASQRQQELQRDSPSSGVSFNLFCREASPARAAKRSTSLIRERELGAIPNIPNKSPRGVLSLDERHLASATTSRFNKLKQLRRIASCYDKLCATFSAFIQIAAVRISWRLVEPTA